MQNHELLFKRIIKEKRNTYITGEAGTGKSYLLTELTHALANEEKNFAVLAPTGLAAVNVRGQTIHKFCSLPPKPGYQLLENIESMLKPAKKKLFKQLDIIIIDEISMVRADLLDAMDALFRLNRDNPYEHFGGLQVVFFGDHYQLPPILNYQEKPYFQEYYKSPYFFDAQCYDSLGLLNCKLTKNYRQKDTHFIELLQMVRTGNVQPVELEYLNSELQISPNFEEEYTITIASHNQQVDEKNKYHLDKLATKEFVYKATIEGNFDEKQSPVEPELHLKIDAQVMFLKNDSEGRWVNGTIGKVVSLTKKNIQVEINFPKKQIVEVTPEKWEKIEYTFNVNKGNIEEGVTGRLIQFPLKLAWATSIHKSQGQTYDRCFVDLGYGAFAPGQTYVALSRARTLEGLHLKRQLKINDIYIDTSVKEFDESTDWNAEL
jgi:ATP-dependent DNA helicase PIF1